MEKDLSNKMILKLRSLGFYQITGGIIGLVLTAWLISGLTIVSSSLIILFCAAIGLYMYSIYCGILLLRKNEFGLRHSLINQILQLFNISCFGFTFQYISGVFVSAGIDLTGSILFTFNIGVSQWKIVINGNREILVLNINLVALFFILFIEKMKNEIKEHRDRLLNSI